MLEDVTIAIGERTILDRITLKCGPGAPTVLVGPNGSGKTTLLRLMMGLIKPSSGRVTWGGRDDAPPIRRAIVFQRPTMLRRGAASNIRYALKAAHIPRTERDNRIAELLKLVGLEGLGERPARRLSGGEQQRLALARALARDPTVLLLDEPTTSLDPAATKGFEEVIRAVAGRGIKVVMSTHDLGAARRLAGDVVLLHRGRVIETGPAPSFFKEPIREETRRFIAGELLV
jgi:tungstate transport system ATP-binding protein